MKARIVNGFVVDACVNPLVAFHPSIAAEFIPATENVCVGWSYNSNTGAFSPPASDGSSAINYAVLSPIDFKMCFMSNERIAINTAAESDAVIKDFWGIVDDQRLQVINCSLKSIQDGVTYIFNTLEDIGIVTDKETRIEQVLTGTRL